MTDVNQSTDQTTPETDTDQTTSDNGQQGNTTKTNNKKKRKLTDWDNMMADVKTAKSVAEGATEDKNKVYKKLLGWWNNFAKMVDVAVEENPQLKEQISVVTPTTQ